MPERRQKELEFSSALGAVLNVVKGSAAPETGQAYARARELWEQLGSPLEFIEVPCGQSRYHAHRGELDRAQSLAEDLLHLSRRRNDSAGLVVGHYSCGRNLMWVGNFASSRSHLEAVLALYDPNSHHSLLRQTGIHPQLAAQAALGIVLFCLGFPDQALAQSNKSIAEARRLPHPPTLAMSLGMGAHLRSIIGDDIGLGQRVDDLVAVATDQGFPFHRAKGAIFRGWVKANNADVTESLSLLRSGSSAYCATGATAWMPLYIALLAGVCEIAGQIEEAAARLDDALQLVERTGSAGSPRSSIGRKVGCCYGKAIPKPPRSCIAKPSASPESRKPSCGNCAPPRALPDCGATRVAAPRPATSSPRSTAGSPRASPPPILKRQRCCSTNWTRSRQFLWP